MSLNVGFADDCVLYDIVWALGMEYLMDVCWVCRGWVVFVSGDVEF
jgi:hypothetical protein